MIYTVSANPALDLTLTVPAIEFETVLRAYEVRQACGGKGFNVSRFLKALAIENVSMAFAAGHTGRALEDGLRAAGIMTDFVYVAGETRTNVVIQEPEGRRHIKVNQPGATVTAADLATFLARVQATMQLRDIWVLTGSLAPGMSTAFYAELTALLHQVGAQVVLDTSGQALLAGCAARPQLVKPNVVEAAEFVGKALDTREQKADAVRQMLEAGAEKVILSMGGDGAIAGDSSGVFAYRPPAVEVKTAVGAGDALVSGAVWAMLRGLPLQQIGRWGVTAGTVTAMHDDLPANAWTELESIYRQIQVEELC